MSYALSCPNCGASLSPVALDPQTAPWICGPPAGCGRGWWVAELSAAARQGWRSGYADFGHGALRGEVQGLVERERVAAAGRGTSALPEQLPLLDVSALQGLAGRRLDGSFTTLVDAEIGRRA